MHEVLMTEESGNTLAERMGLVVCASASFTFIMMCVFMCVSMVCCCLAHEGCSSIMYRYILHHIRYHVCIHCHHCYVSMVCVGQLVQSQ